VAVFDLGDTKLESPVGFLGFVEEKAEWLLRRTPDSWTFHPTRRLIDAKMISVESPTSCVRYRLDGEAQPSNEAWRWGRIPHRVSADGMYCRHPYWPRIVIDARLEQWFPLGKAPRPVEPSVEAFLQSLSFTRDRPHALPPTYLDMVTIRETRPWGWGQGFGVRGLAVGENAVWATRAPTSLFRIDAVSKVRTAISVGREPEGVAVGEGSVWVANREDGTMSRVDPNTNRVTDTILVGKKPVGLAVGFGAVWVANSGSGTVSRVDPMGRRVSATIPVGEQPTAVAVGENAIWVTLRSEGSVIRIDPHANEIVGGPVAVGRDPRGIAIGEGTVWVTSFKDAKVSRIDAKTGRLVAEVRVGKRPVGVAVEAGTVWVTGYEVARIDPQTNEEVGDRLAPPPDEMGWVPSAITGGDGRVWLGTGYSARLGEAIFHIGPAI
jgi:YVTN family beta-propeller protein